MLESTTYTWQGLMNLVHSYHRQVLELPQDRSIFSPKAKVAVHKRRLMIIQQMHRHFLKVCRDPAEIITQIEEERLFIDALKDICQSAHLNVWSTCEAKQMSFLLTNVLVRCQADSSTVFAFITAVFSAVNQFSPKSVCNAEVLNSLIMSCSLFEAFPKLSFSFCPQAFKQCVLIMNHVASHPEKSDYINSCLRLVLSVAHHPDDRLNPLDRSGVTSKICDFMRNGGRDSSILSAKIYSALLTKMNLEKKHVKSLLSLLNGPLSIYLYEAKECFNLLECCLDFVPPNESMCLQVLFKNIRRAQHFPFIDSRLFSECLASAAVKLQLDRDNFVSLVSKLICKNPDLIKPIHPNMLESFVYNYITMQSSEADMRKAFSLSLNFFKTPFIIDNPAYCRKLVCALHKVALYRPRYFDFSLFENFSPLTSVDESVQTAAIQFITALFHEKPVQLCNQLVVVFGQLKGDFVRIAENDPNVDEVSVSGLLKLYLSLLRLLFCTFREYVDEDLYLTVHQWAKRQFKSTGKSPIYVSLASIILFLCNKMAIKDDCDYVRTLLSNFSGLDAILLFSKGICDDKPSSEHKCFFTGHFSFLESMIEALDSSILNTPPHGNIYGIMYFIGNNCLGIEAQPSQLAGILGVFTKLFAAVPFVVDGDLNLLSEILSFKNVTSLYSKMFWRCSEEARVSFLNFWKQYLTLHKGGQYFQIVHALQAVLEEKCGTVSGKLFDAFQSLCQALLDVQEFSLRTAVGSCIGSLVDLLPSSDLENIKALSNQIYKYALSPSSFGHKKQIIYLIAQGKLNGFLRFYHVQGCELAPQALLGMLCSASRQSKDPETKSAVLLSLAHYINVCGASLHNEFYCEVCEFLYEHVFLHSFSLHIAESVVELLKSLVLYAKVLDDASKLVFDLVKTLVDTEFLQWTSSAYFNTLIELLNLNPEAFTYPRLAMSNLSSRISQDNVILMSHLYSRMIEIDHYCVKFVIDDGIWGSVLRCVQHCPQSYSFCEPIVSFATMLLRYSFSPCKEYWFGSVLPILFTSTGEEEFRSTGSESVVEQDDLVSKSTFSLSDLHDALKAEMKSQLPFMPSSIIFHAFERNARLIAESELKSLAEAIPVLFKLFISIGNDFSNDRQLMISCLRIMSELLSSASLASCCGLSKFDNQFVAIISSCLKSSNDPYIASLAYRCIFRLLSIREDIRDDVFCGKSRILRLLKEVPTVLQTDGHWNRRSVLNEEILSVILGLLDVQKSGLDITCIDPNVHASIKRQVVQFFDAVLSSGIDSSMLDSLSANDRLLLSEVAVKFMSMSFDKMVDFFGDVHQLSARHIRLLLSLPHESKQLIPVFRQLMRHERGLCSLGEVVQSMNQEDQALLAAELSIALPAVNFSNFSYGFNFINLLLKTPRVSTFDSRIIFDIMQTFIERSIENFNESKSKPIIVLLKNVLASGIGDDFELHANEFVKHFLQLIENPVVDSFLMQLVTFCICTRQSLWSTDTFAAFRKLFDKTVDVSATEEQEIVQVLVENWILLLKTASKGGLVERFDENVRSISSTVLSRLTSMSYISDHTLSLLEMAKDLCAKSQISAEQLEMVLSNK